MSENTPAQKPALSFWQIWNMSFGFFGIQFGWGLQMANMSAIYQFLGAGEEDIAILWLAAPLTGFIVQPIIGYMSDRTWTRLGRRRPYFLVGALFASLALIAMPNSSALWMAAGLLWVLDAAVNISMEPFRAFVGDLLPSQQRKVGFAMQSLLIGAGAVLASYMPTILTDYLHIATGSPDVILQTVEGVQRSIDLDTAIPAAVHLSFYIGAALFFSAVLYTILTTKEHPPVDMEAFEKMKAESSGVGAIFKEIIEGVLSMPKTMQQLAVVQFFTWFGLFCFWLYFVPGMGTQVFDGETLGEELSHHSEIEESTALRYVAAAKEALKKDADSSEPVEMSVAEYVAKVALLAEEEYLNLELTPMQQRNPLFTTTAYVLLAGDSAGNPTLAATALEDRLSRAEQYERGVRNGQASMGNYNLVAFFFSFLLIVLVRKFSAKSIHGVSLCLGGIGFLIAGSSQSMGLIFLAMVFIGIAWASILSMPYAMLSNAIPGDKMGFYMGVFNFFIVLPQILASLGLGFVMSSLLGGKAMNAVILGGFSFFIAALALLRVSAKVTETSSMD
jgi:maltose/moltooligosaccharide transporter